MAKKSSDSKKIKEIIEAVDLIDIVLARMDMKRKGNTWVGCCPFHDEKTASFKIKFGGQNYRCFGCDASGDALDFVVNYDGVTKAEGIKILEGDIVATPDEKRKKRDDAAIAEKHRKKWVQAPITKDTPKAPEANYNGVKYKTRYAYKDAAGNLLGYQCRFEAGGAKEIKPLTWCTDNEGRFEWRWQGLDAPRPIYNLDLLTANPDWDVLLVEGEKTADALQGFLEDVAVITWPFGSNGVEHVNWEPLAGRNVFFWPDNDAQGLSAMLHILSIVKDTIKGHKILTLNYELEKGWDGADREWDESSLLAYIKAHETNEIPTAREVPGWFVKQYGNPIKVWACPQVGTDEVYYFGYADKSPNHWVFKKPTEKDLAADEPPPAEDDGSPIEDRYATPYFRYLGYDKSENGTMSFYFFVYRSRQVVRLTPSGMTKSNLLTIASLDYWNTEYPGKMGFNLELAQTALIEKSYDVGYFDDDVMRGLGAWIDGDKVVLHVGDGLFIDGRKVSISEHPSRFIYEGAKALHFVEAKRIDAHAGQKFLDLLKLADWEREISAYLLAGFCVIAPFCGVLKWRPHIWITGAAGSGKSYIFEKIVRPVIGNMALAVQGDTSDAGLRQALGHAALPVIFDEAEAEGKKEADRIQAILQLIRGASTDDGGVIIKGTAGGSHKTFRIRSCFAFASIAMAITQQADKSRISILSLKNSEYEERKVRRDKSAALRHELLNESFINGLRARTMWLIPTILENARTFAAAAAQVIGEQRAGDQLGAMLAGAHSLVSSKVISYDEAVAWVKARNWDEEMQGNEERDELNLLNYMLDSMVEAEFEQRRYKRTIGELILKASHRAKLAENATDGLTPEACYYTLKRLGVRVENTEVWFSNKSKYLNELLKENPGWAKSRRKILLRLPGAHEVESKKFAGVNSRSVSVPLEVIDPPDDTAPPSPPQPPADNTPPPPPVTPADNGLSETGVKTTTVGEAFYSIPLGKDPFGEDAPF